MAIDPDKAHAFLSYTRSDDVYLEGGITWLRGALEKAVHAHTGSPFQIFQDVEDIELGDRWGKKLDQALAQAQLFIPILTPSFFRSDFCRREARAFLKYEKRAERDDLILPLYLIEAPLLEQPGLRAADDLAKDLSRRQHADWRDVAVKLQHENKPPIVADEIASLATAIARAVARYAEPVVAVVPELTEPEGSDSALAEELLATKTELADLEKQRADERRRLREKETMTEQAAAAEAARLEKLRDENNRLQKAMADQANAGPEPVRSAPSFRSKGLTAALALLIGAGGAGGLIYLSSSGEVEQLRATLDQARTELSAAASSSEGRQAEIDRITSELADTQEQLETAQAIIEADLKSPEATAGPGETSPASAAAAQSVTIQVQSVIPASSDEVHMLNEFGKDVSDLTNGEVNIEILPAGSVVGVQQTLDAVDAGLIDGGFAWTHYWSGKHPAAMLFGSPVAGAGVGIDNIAFLSWFQYGGGKELYDRLWDEMGVNVKGFMLQPVGPEALGWFKEPIASMEDFRKLRFRTPPGIPGQAYNDIGVAGVAMGGGDILPALEKGIIDAAEWCCPKADRKFGFQKVLKHYYLQGLHQAVVNADLYINGDVYDELTDHQKKALEVAANASLSKAMSYRIYENGGALKDLTENHGVQLQDTPLDYFTEYMNAAHALLEEVAADNEFFAEVWNSQRAFAEFAVPFWAGAQTSNANLGKAFADSLD